MTSERFRTESWKENPDAEAKTKRHPHTVHFLTEVLEREMNILQGEIFRESVVILCQHIRQMFFSELFIRGAVQEIPEIPDNNG